MLVSVVELGVSTVEQLFDCLDEVAYTVGLFQESVGTRGTRFRFAIGGGKEDDGCAAAMRH